MTKCRVFIEAVRIGMWRRSYPVKDYGTYSDASVDYPDFGHALGEKALRATRFIQVSAFAAVEGNRHDFEQASGVRAGLAWCKEIAHLVRQQRCNVIGTSRTFHRQQDPAEAISRRVLYFYLRGWAVMSAASRRFLSRIRKDFKELRNLLTPL